MKAVTDNPLTGLPAPIHVSVAEVLAERGPGTPQLVVIDDHSTGSQSMADVPILTAWSADLIEWALATDAPAIFIVTNARSLGPSAAENRYWEVMAAVIDVAASMKRSVAFAVRSDSGLRSHYPLDSDVMVNAIESSSRSHIDGVITIAAFPEAGRITVDGVHYASEAGTVTPIAETRFAREPGFAYTTSDLRHWIVEKTRGRYQLSDIVYVGLATIRSSPDAVAAQLMNVRGGQPVVMDAVTEDDLRAISIGVLRAMAVGKTFLYRVTAPFVRAIVGQPIHDALTVTDINSRRGAATGLHGLIVVGNPVPFTRRQVRELTQRRPIRTLALSVPALLDTRRDAHLEDVVTRAVEGLAISSVVVQLTDLVTGNDTEGDSTVDPRIASAINEVVFQISKREHLAFVVARGGSIVPAVAQGLAVRRAMVRGPLLPGIVSWWEPVSGRIKGVPFAVYAGGVGDDAGLADVVDKLSGITPPERPQATALTRTPPTRAERLAMIGLGSKGLPVAQRLNERYSVRAWDLDPHARDVARLAGVDVADSAQDAIHMANTVLLAVRDADGLRDALDGVGGVRSSLPPGTVLIVLMALPIDDLQRIAAELTSRGVHVLDAPISAGGELARRGEIACLVGGTPQVVDTVLPILEQLAATVIVAGNSVGDGQAMKAVNQLAAAVTMAGVAEALALAETLGLDPELTLRAISAGAAGSYMAADRGPRMVQAANGITPHLVNRLDVTAAELAVAAGIARDSMVATPVTAATEQVMLRAMTQLDPDADDAEIIRAVIPPQ